MKRSIFISRNLSEDSLLLSYLQENNWEIHHQSLIEIKPIPFKIDHKTDWIFISSSNGARILFEDYLPDSTIKIGVVGKATANAVRSFRLEPSFIGETGDMYEVGRDFGPVLADRAVRFYGAEAGSEILRSELPNEQVSFTPIYRTELITDIELPKTEYVFLTSPSNAKAYLHNTSIEGKLIIAIGNTTAKYLASRGSTDVHIPTDPTEEHVIGLLHRFTH
jgi:uroporphyrinogen-III synthase